MEHFNLLPNELAITLYLVINRSSEFSQTFRLRSSCEKSRQPNRDLRSMDGAQRAKSNINGQLERSRLLPHDNISPKFEIDSAGVQLTSRVPKSRTQYESFTRTLVEFNKSLGIFSPEQPMINDKPVNLYMLYGYVLKVSSRCTRRQYCYSACTGWR